MAHGIFGREALGEGDVKLLGCIGAFCGWKGAIFAIFGGAMIGSFFTSSNNHIFQAWMEKDKG